MKINYLSKMTGINPETIRSYRERGLIHPRKLDNGYYDYDMENLIELIYVRKMRGFHIPLQIIHDFYDTNDSDMLLSEIDVERNNILSEMNALKERLRFLELEKQHILESEMIESQQVILTQSIDDKIDIYDDIKDMNSEFLKDFSEIYPMSTPVLHISKEILNGPIEDRIVPMRAGIGTYRYIMNENNIPIPPNSHIVPNGISISMMIQVQNLSGINILQIAPMMKYAKMNNQTFLSGTTGYLVRIQMIDNQPTYLFRIRACVEQNDVQEYSDLIEDKFPVQ